MAKVQAQEEPGIKTSNTAGIVKAKTVIISPIDEKARYDNAPKQPGLCVDEICSCNLHNCYATQPSVPFEATSTYRIDYGNRFTGHVKPPVVYTADNPPPGVDPEEWRKYVEKHKPLQEGDVIPAWLYYKPTVETRDFCTENRQHYNNKFVGNEVKPTLYTETNPPPGVNLKEWKAYVKKHGPLTADKVPAWLFYNSVPDGRDFATQYRINYTPHRIDVCPINKLPQYPKAEWPRQHTFWDPVANVWY